MVYPDWVLGYKQKGTTIRLVNGKYLLYKVHSERRKDKKYPVLVQDEFLGVITEEGIKTSSKKMIDVSNIETMCLVDINYLFKEEYDPSELDILRKVYLVKVQGKWYFPKLTEYQSKILIAHNVEVTHGIIF
jgi:hypothetical protein